MRNVFPDTGTALVLLVAFVLPGFVTVLLQERTFRLPEEQTAFDRLLRSVYYSVWIYLLLALVAMWQGVDRAYVERTYDRLADDPAQLVWRAAILVFVPAALVASATWLWHRFGRMHRHQEPTAWDFFFRKRRECFVRAWFPDGRTVLGYYGGDSFAAYGKDGGDLFLEALVLPNEDQKGWFGGYPPNNCGVWIRAGEAVVIEFYDPKNEQGLEPSATEGPGEAVHGRPRAAETEREAGKTEPAAATAEFDASKGVET